MDRRTHSFSGRILTAALSALLGAPAAGALLPTGAEPRFHIQAIEVRGAKNVSSAIVASESLLEAGQVYTESELRDAVDRIRRLPFILDVGFGLGKGRQRGTYVLLVDVEETRPLFYELSLGRTWFGEPVAFESNGVLDDNLAKSILTAGARLSVGPYGLLFAAVGNEGARLGFERYNLLGMNAVLSLGLASETCCPASVAPLGLDPALSSWIDEAGATSATVSLGVPLGAHQSVRGSLAVRRTERGLRRPVLGELEAGDLFDVKDRREQEIRLAWNYDTTDDPVFPFEGTNLGVSLDFRTLEADLSSPAVAGASPTEMSSELVRLSVLGRRHWPFGRRQAFAAGLSVAVGRGHVENLPVAAGALVEDKLSSWELTATIRHSLNLVEAKRARRFRELYWQNTLEYSVDDTSLGLGYRPVEVASFSSAIVFRNDWGVVRFGLSFIDVGDVL